MSDGIRLSGGNMNAVVRIGDTVRRAAGPWTPTVHRYLNYLRAVGIDWSPRPISVDGGHELLSFVAGEVPVYPLPGWVWEGSVLVEGARRLRALHDASIGFPLEGAVWQSAAHAPSEVICHNDFAPHNLAFVDGAIVGAIDFDMCSPGPRLWDVAYFATRAVPLTAEPPAGAPDTSQARDRVRLILDSYGSDADWLEVIRVAIVRLTELAEFSRRKADELRKPNLRQDAVGYERDARFLRGVLADASAG